MSVEPRIGEWSPTGRSASADKSGNRSFDSATSWSRATEGSFLGEDSWDAPTSPPSLPPSAAPAKAESGAGQPGGSYLGQPLDVTVSYSSEVDPYDATATNPPSGSPSYPPGPPPGPMQQPVVTTPPTLRTEVPRRGVSTVPTYKTEVVSSSCNDDSSDGKVVASPASGWGWRSLVAFLAGGVLVAGGFAVGRIGNSTTDAAGPISGVVQPTESNGQPLGTAGETAPPSSSQSRSSPAANDLEPAAHVADVLGPAVVQVNAGNGTGSGILYDDGLVMTNHHVVAGVTSINILLSDGQLLPGTVLGSSENVDIAVISVGQGLGHPIAELATGEKAQVGQTAIAIGSPFRLQQSVTEGIVSAVDRPIFSGPNGRSVVAMIQTDAPINPGNSGGALADRQGRVIGINTAIQTGGTSNSNAGVGFAIPIDTALSVANRIVAGEPIESGFLGVSGQGDDDGLPGVTVTEVTPGSAAETAGLVPGDRVLSLDGAPVIDINELAGLVVAKVPGDIVELEVIRNGEPTTLSVTLGVRPPDDGG